MAISKLFNVVSELEWVHLQNKNINFKFPAPINFPTSNNRTNTCVTPFFQNTQEHVHPQQKLYHTSHESSTLVSA